ncbi:branched-chain amino acid ABC transporter substrate-binding protein [Phyllobacterium sp. YR531]|uniref:branched-chain amino acid ABC transporter substrate-binding protein n=1 Tax=Phyllobacterium sp. YR531 TaxID=1144343 RepID=UPI00026F7EB2|nr:branched-chain amino acid ABC transporter substrate-binding protein [Phyllobacterium sp. YR531]EJN01702.1 ABC-type branched-chain amino acid transport system, periplasmic component [Phyllobacterium sp. YR531]
MTLLIRTTTLVLGLVFCTIAHAEDKIGVVAPISGAFSRLGNQLVDGAAIAIASDKSGQAASIVTRDDSCTAAGGAEAAKQLLQSDALIVIGFLCTESLEAALPILGQKGIAIITPAIRSQTLTELRTDQRYPVFRLAPSNRNEVSETSTILADLWRSTPFAIIDDGTIFGRELTSGIRLRLEEKGLKPVFSDTYRPGLDNQNALVGRLKRAGATQVFVGGERDDVAAIGRSATALDYPLTIIGSEALNASGKENDLASGTLMIAPRAAQTLESARTAKNAVELAGKVPEGYTIAAYAAGEIARDVLNAARSQAGSISELLRKTTFETALGPVQFDAAGERIADTYRLQKYDGKQFVPETN